MPSPCTTIGPPRKPVANKIADGKMGVQRQIRTHKGEAPGDLHLQAATAGVQHPRCSASRLPSP